jgi:hypothetical protein
MCKCVSSYHRGARVLLITYDCCTHACACSAYRAARPLPQCYLGVVLSLSPLPWPKSITGFCGRAEIKPRTTLIGTAESTKGGQIRRYCSIEREQVKINTQLWFQNVSMYMLHGGINLIRVVSHTEINIYGNTKCCNRIVFTLVHISEERVLAELFTSSTSPLPTPSQKFTIHQLLSQPVVGRRQPST